MAKRSGYRRAEAEPFGSLVWLTRYWLAYSPKYSVRAPDCQAAWAARRTSFTFSRMSH
jgi:hypothetical protein